MAKKETQIQMKLTKRKGFNFFRSYYDVYNELSDKDKIAFIDALLDRQFLGVKPTNLTGMAKFAYISQTNSIDGQVKGFEDKTGIHLSPSQPPTEGGNEPPSLQVKVKEKEEVKVKEKEEVKGKDVNPKKFLDDYFKTKEEAFEELKSDDLYIDECHRLITGKGWRVATKVNLMQILVVFLLGKADLTNEKSDVKKHFKNWLIRENLDTLTKICNEG